MNGPDFGVLIVRLAILAAAIICGVTPGPPIQHGIAALAFAWLAVSAVSPYLRRWVIRLSAASAARRGDIWMRDAAAARTAAWRTYCQEQAHKAYGRAEQVRSQEWEQ